MSKGETRLLLAVFAIVTVAHCAEYGLPPNGGPFFGFQPAVRQPIAPGPSHAFSIDIHNEGPVNSYTVPIFGVPGYLKINGPPQLTAPIFQGHVQVAYQVPSVGDSGFQSSVGSHSQAYTINENSVDSHSNVESHAANHGAVANSHAFEINENNGASGGLTGQFIHTSEAAKQGVFSNSAAYEINENESNSLSSGQFIHGAGESHQIGSVALGGGEHIFGSGISHQGAISNSAAYEINEKEDNSQSSGQYIHGAEFHQTDFANSAAFHSNEGSLHASGKLVHGSELFHHGAVGSSAAYEINEKESTSQGVGQYIHGAGESHSVGTANSAAYTINEASGHAGGQNIHGSNEFSQGAFGSSAGFATGGGIAQIGGEHIHGSNEFSQGAFGSLAGLAVAGGISQIGGQYIQGADGHNQGSISNSAAYTINEGSSQSGGSSHSEGQFSLESGKAHQGEISNSAAYSINEGNSGSFLAAQDFASHGADNHLSTISQAYEINTKDYPSNIFTIPSVQYTAPLIFPSPESGVPYLSELGHKYPSIQTVYGSPN